MKDYIRIHVSRKEYWLLLEMIEVFTQICADDQKNIDAKELLEDLKDVKKEYAITETEQPGICD